MLTKVDELLKLRIEISVFTDILVLRFYGYIGNIGEISVDIFSQILMSENYLKLIGMLEKTSKNDKISKNAHFKVIL